MLDEDGLPGIIVVPWPLAKQAILRLTDEELVEFTGDLLAYTGICSFAERATVWLLARGKIQAP